QKAAAVIGCGAAANVAEIKSVKVDQLNGEVPSLLNRRPCDYHRLRPEVQTESGVGRVRVGDLNDFVIGRKDPGHVADLVPGRFELRVVTVHEVGVLDAVAVYHWKAVDVGFLGDGASFGG